MKPKFCDFLKRCQIIIEMTTWGWPGCYRVSHFCPVKLQENRDQLVTRKVIRNVRGYVSPKALMTVCSHEMPFITELGVSSLVVLNVVAALVSQKTSVQCLLFVARSTNKRNAVKAGLSFDVAPMSSQRQKKPQDALSSQIY